jgi:hypothetical protein
MSNGDAIGCLVALAAFVVMFVLLAAAALFKATGIWGFLALTAGGLLLWVCLRYQKDFGTEAEAETASTTIASAAVSTPDRQCTAMTRKGLRCKNAAVRNGRCARHSADTSGATDSPQPTSREATEGDLFVVAGSPQTADQAGLPANRPAVEGDILLDKFGDLGRRP